MKKILSLLLIAVMMVFALTGCISIEDSDEDLGEDATWIENYYVDEFDEPTDKRYIQNQYVIFGEFSNSATTDSNLEVTVTVDDEQAGIFLREYGSQLVKNNGSYDDNYTITLRTESGEEKVVNGAIYPGGDRVILKGEAKDTFVNLLSGEEDIKVLIVNDEFKTSKYLFEMTPDNFADVY